jgi:hypothetical protein
MLKEVLGRDLTERNYNMAYLIHLDNTAVAALQEDINVLQSTAIKII